MIDPERHVPAEWTAQACVWIGWPSAADLWQDDLAGARREVAALVAALAPSVPVRLIAGDAAAAVAAREMCPGRVTVRQLPMGDIWLRDTGPVYALDAGRPVGLTFTFNGWGGKYDLPGDRETAGAMLAVDGIDEARSAFILEGGAIDHDGAGCLLTTRQCLLNANRNRGWTEEEAASRLSAAFGASRVVWLGDGLAGDHTDGHVDNVARFIGPNRVACQRPCGAGDPNRDVLGDIEARLRDEGFDVVTIPSPGLVTDEGGDPVAASHMNFVFANGRIIMPVYGEEAGAEAVAALAAAMPGHEITGLPSVHVLTGGGSFHCISQQVPRAVLDPGEFA